VKVLSPQLAYDPRARRRFEREAESAAAVQHPNVVSVFQVGELPESGTSYFVMQYVEGKTLAEAFPEGTVVPVLRAKRIIGEIASALAAAHGRGLVHRDIKPSNVMLEADTDRVIVLDFGISAAVSTERASQAGTKLTEAGLSVGTPQYMSPEQAAGEQATEKSDVYSLGLVAFELLAGKPVFDEPSPMALAAAHINKEPPELSTLRADVPGEIASLVKRCLVKRAETRPASAAIAAALISSRTALLEWPPPGLEKLQAVGRALTRSALVLGVCGILLSAVLTLQPAAASSQWQGGESGLWVPAVGLMTPPDLANPAADPPARAPTDPTPVWLLLVAVCTVGWGAALVVLGLMGVRLLGWCVWARAAGYPWSMVGKTAVERSSDVSELLNGMGVFGLLSDGERRRVERLRAGRELLLWTATGWSAALPIVGFWYWRLPSESQGVLLEGGEFAFLLFPLLMLGTAMAVAVWAERRLIGVEAKSRRRLRERPLPPSQLVTGWLTASGRPAGRTARILHVVAVRRVAVWVLAVLSVPVILYCAATVLLGMITIGLMTGQLRRGHENAVAWLADTGAVERIRAAETRLANGGIEATRQPAMEAAAYLLRVTAAPAERPDPALALNEDENLAFLRLSRTWSRLSPAVRDSLGALITVDSSDAVYRAVRDVARGAKLPPFWVTNDEGPFVRGFWWRNVQRVEFRVQAVGLKALIGGDYGAAIETARDLLAFGDRIDSDPNLRMAGFTFRNAGIDLLEFVSAVHVESGLASEVAELRTALSASMRERGQFYGTVAALGAALPPTALMRLLADSTVPLSVRIGAFRGLRSGFCFSPREVLFGVDSARVDAIREARGVLRDIPSVADEATGLERDLRELWEGPFGVAAGAGLGMPEMARFPLMPSRIRNAAARSSICNIFHRGWAY
jgi:hypothetical protein